MKDEIEKHHRSAAGDQKAATPQRHHLDKRARELAHEEVPADALLKTKELATRLGVSTQFLEIARHRGFGPRFHKLSKRSVRYLWADVVAWLEDRHYQRTAEYMAPKAGA